MLLRIEPFALIVPRVLVAEVIKMASVNFISGTHKAIRTFEWRGFHVPHISSSAVFAGHRGSEEETEDSKVVIFHGLSNPQKLPFYAFTVTRHPQLVMVTNENISENKSAGTLNDAELLQVTVNGEVAVIPRIDTYEKFILSSHFN